MGWGWGAGVEITLPGPVMHSQMLRGPRRRRRREKWTKHWHIKYIRIYILLKKLFYLWLCRVLVALHGLPLVVVSGATLHCGTCTSLCSGFSGCGAQALGVRALEIAVHRLLCSKACGIFLDQRLNPCPLRWQAGSYPLHHQGSTRIFLTSTQIYTPSFCFATFDGHMACWLSFIRSFSRPSLCPPGSPTLCPGI